MNWPYKYFFLLSLIAICCETKGQTNLVYNGDFEIYSSCPNTISSPGNIEITKCDGWTNPTDATPDYYNACNSNGIVGVPLNNTGFQNARSGNGYMGTLFYSAPNGIWREYIQGSIINTLKQNQKYQISFYISLADISRVASSNIGCYLSNNLINFPTYTQALNIVPQIKNNTGFLTDTLNWMKVEGEFYANGDEKYITIGWFGNDNVSDTLNTGMYYGNPYESYYYIDDVTLIEKECSTNVPNVFTPNKDESNDVLIFSLCADIVKTSIYNRWGNIVFQTEKVNYYWDGRTTSGEECVEGNYFYIIETKEKKIKGFIQLIR